MNIYGLETLVVKYLQKLCLAIAMTFSIGVASAPLAVAETFVFTAIPDENETRLRERFNKIAKYLYQSLGV